MKMNPPVPKKIVTKIEKHNDVREDEYFWMRNLKEDTDVKSHLDLENEYAKYELEDTKDLQETLYKELRSTIKEKDQTVPAKCGEYYYYERHEEGMEYAIHCRKRGVDGAEEVILDENILAKNKEYCDVGEFEVSPDHKLLAYAVDFDGSEEYDIYFKDLSTGELLGDVLPRNNCSISWFNDNKTLAYNLLDDNLRPYRIMVHKLGTKVEDDICAYEEESAEYFLTCSKSFDDKYVFINASGSASSESYFLDASEFKNDIKLITKRRDFHEYYAEHHFGYFYILTNDKHPNFRIVRTPVDSVSEENWREVEAPCDDSLIENFISFKSFSAICKKVNGLKEIYIVTADGERESIDFPEDSYSVDFGENLEYDSNKLRYLYSSPIKPPCVFEYEVETKSCELLKMKEVPGFDSDKYFVERLFAPTKDKKSVPVTVIYRKDTPKDGSSNLFLYGYGSYSMSIDPGFKRNIFPLVDRGFIYAIAHVRGSDTLGRSWYEDGKFLNKKNTFLDFIASAEFLCENKYTSRGQISINGGSAGGMLVAASMNMADEDLFKSVVADVPFVDVLNTMLDKDLPLTQIEYKEWGNPEEKEYYDYIKSYSPYDNIKERSFPHILALAGLNDPRVTYWEPMKWIARIRDRRSNNNMCILKVNMGAGHFGTTGRFEYLKEEALIYAFILKANGVCK